MSESADARSAEEPTTGSGWKLQFGILCGMLLMALIGMGVSQASEQGAWQYWLVVVVTYAGLGLWRSTRKARQNGQPVRKLIGHELAHWSVLLVFLAILLLLERKEIIQRDSASDFALLLLAFSCCLAGIHFDWLLLVMGVVLTAMLVAMATLAQYSIVLWVVMVGVAITAAAFVYFKAKRGGAVANGS